MPRSCGRRSRSAARAAASRTRARSCARQVALGLAASPIGQVLVERFLAGWQEHELEVMCDARRQLRRRLLDREPRPDGRPHGRLVDGGAAADAARTPSTSACARRRSRCARAVGVATGGANVQFAVRAATTRELRVIEMNPRVSRSSALASKATGFPIAKLAALLAVGYTLDELPNDITGQTTRGVRARARLRRRQGAALRLRQVPRRRAGARQRDARRRRGARARPDVPRGVPQGARGREARSRSTWLAAASRSPGAGIAARGGAAGARPAGIHPYWATSCARSPPRSGLVDGGDVAAAKRFGLPTRASPRCSASPRPRCAPPAAPGPARRRLVRRRVRGADALLLPLVRGRRRAARALRPRGGRARQRPEPDRPGHRVRLLLRPRRAGAAQARLRGGARQLEPRDGLDRLRHLRPALPRAAHARARARRLRAGAAARRRRLARRPDAARARARRSPRPACRCSATRSTRSISPRTAGASRRCSRSSACRRPSGASRQDARRRSRSPSGSATRCSSARTTCSAGAACASCARPDELDARRAVPRRPLPRGRDRARRRRPVRRRRRVGRRGARARRAGRRPLGRLGLRAARRRR